MAYNSTNGFITTLNGAMNNSQTTATLTSSTGAPAAPFIALIVGEGGNTDEIILVGAISGTSLSSITRAFEPIADGTQTAQAHSSGATITQALTVQGVRDLGLSSTTIGATAYHSTTQGSLTNNLYNALNLDSEEFDTDGFHDTGSNTSRMTIPAGLSGKYLVIFSTSVNQIFYVGIKKNGTKWSVADGTTNASGSRSTSTIMDLVAGDYIEGYEFHSSGTGTAGNSDTDGRTKLSIVKLDSGRIGKGVGARAYHSSTQAIAVASGEVAFTLDTERWDTDGFHDPVTNNSRFTIPTGMGGKYAIGAAIRASAAGASGTYIAIKKNGSDYLCVSGIYSDQFTSPTTVVDLVAGDYVELYGTSGSGTTTFGTSTSTNQHGIDFWIARLDSNASGVLAQSVYTRTSGDYTGITSTSFVDLDSTNMNLTVTTGARRVLLTFTGAAYYSSGSDQVRMTFSIDGTDIGGTSGILAQFATTGAVANATFHYLTDVLSAGSHTFKVRVRTSSGTLVVTGNTNNISQFSAIELPDSGAMVANQGFAIAQAYYGYNAIGASFGNMNGGYAKQITLANAGLINSIDGYIKGNSTNASSLWAHIMTDNAGVPGIVIAKHNSVDFGSLDKNFDMYITSTGRWVSVPMSAYLAAGTYWIVLQGGHNDGGTQLAFDGSGTDYTNTSIYAGDAGTVTYSSGSNKYSIRASFIAGTGSPLIRRPGATIQKLRVTSGSFTLAGSTTTQTEVSSSLRLTIVASVGDILQITLSTIATVGSPDSEGAIDSATIVGGSIVNQVSGGTRGIGHGYFYGEHSGTIFSKSIVGTLFYTVTSGDLSSGSVTISPTYANTGTLSGTLYATSTYTLNYSVLNLGQ